MIFVILGVLLRQEKRNKEAIEAFSICLEEDAESGLGWRKTCV
jgi:hypothetical protein